MEPSSLGEFGFNGPLVSYYNPDTLREILAARQWLDSNAQPSAEVSLVISALVHILHGNRPYALSRRSHPITPFAPTGPSDYRPLAPRLRDKLARLLDADLGGDWSDGRATEVDVQELRPVHGRADVVITSPPFFGSTRFHVNNWIRLWFTGWEPDDFVRLRQDFVEVRQAKEFDVYRRILANLRGVIRPGGLVVWHLGLSKRMDMAARMAEFAEPSFRVVGHEVDTVAHCQTHGLSSQGVTSDHQFLILQSR
jgi:hypothetical protein